MTTTAPMIISLDLCEPPGPAEIRAFRQSLDLTQAEFAGLLGMSRERWTEYESGTKRPRARTWALALLLVDRHPEQRIVRRPSAGDL